MVDVFGRHAAGVILCVIIATVFLIGGHACGYQQGYRTANAKVLAMPQNGCR